MYSSSSVLGVHTTCTLCVYACRKADGEGRPFAGILWSGRGTVNSHTASSTCPEMREFLATPNQDMQFVNTDTTISLIIFTVYPMIM